MRKTFLVATRLLVLADHVAVVLVERKAGRDACLRVIAHTQLVQVDGWRLVGDERRLLLQPGEIVTRQFVDDLLVRICPRRQIDLSARDVQKAEQVSVG